MPAELGHRSLEQAVLDFSKQAAAAGNCGQDARAPPSNVGSLRQLRSAIAPPVGASPPSNVGSLRPSRLNSLTGLANGRNRYKKNHLHLKENSYA
jgi:hypothetical protein